MCSPSSAAERENVAAAASPLAGSGGCPLSPSSCPAPRQPPPPGGRGRRGGTGACDWPLRCTACRGPMVAERRLGGCQQIERQDLRRKELANRLSRIKQIEWRFFLDLLNEPRKL